MTALPVPPPTPLATLSYNRGAETPIIVSGWTHPVTKAVMDNTLGSMYCSVYSNAKSNAYVVTRVWMNYVSTNTWRYIIPASVCVPNDDLFLILEGFDTNGVSQTVNDAFPTAGGTGYGPTSTITSAGGGGSGFSALPVVSNGVITDIILLNGGTGYTSAPTLGATGGTGFAGTAVVGPLSSNECIMWKSYRMDDRKS